MKKSDPSTMMNYDEIGGGPAIPLGYEVLESNSKSKGDLKQKVA